VRGKIIFGPTTRFIVEISRDTFSGLFVKKSFSLPIQQGMLSTSEKINQNSKEELPK
jgi:hypothetical protein